MNTIDIVQECINYIEYNLKAELTIEELAIKVGYSKYHLYKLFNHFLGMPISQYIVWRKLKHIAYECSHGNSLVDAVYNYGFKTYAGFYKAFYRVYECSPSRYLDSKLPKKPHIPNLKTEVNRMHSQKEIKAILKNWSIEDVDIKPYVYSGAGGIANNVWYVGDKYVLKKGINKSGLRVHILVSKALEKSGFKAATPVQTITGNDFYVDGEFYYYLSHRVSGHWLKKADRYGEKRLYYAKCYGEAIANMHLALQKHDDNIMTNDKNFYEMIVEWAIPKVRKMLTRYGYEIPEEFFDEYKQNFSEIYAELPRHIIHRDPNPSNILFENNKVSGFVDFEISERNIRLYDPCYCATGILSETEDKPELYKKWIDIFKQIIISYNDINTLTKVEIKAIPFVLYSIQLNVIAYLSRYDEYKEHAESNIKMLLFIYDNMNEILESVTSSISYIGEV